MVVPRKKRLPNPPDKGKATMRDVAKRAGVSLATVSYYFSGKHSISSQTERRIDQAISVLGYSLRNEGRPRLTEKFPQDVPRVIGQLLPEPLGVFTKSHMNRLAWIGVRKLCAYFKIKLIVGHITDEQSLTTTIRDNKFEESFSVVILTCQYLSIT